MRLRQIHATITNPSPAGTDAWTNPANIRDSGEPPVVDGTDGTFASASVNAISPTIISMKISPNPTLGNSAVWVGMALDWEMVSTDAGTMVVSSVATGNQIGQFASVPLETGRKRSYFDLIDSAGVDLRTTGAGQPFFYLQLAVGGGTAASGRIYEVGFIYEPRAQTVIIDG